MARSKGGRKVAGAARVYAAAPLTHIHERSLWLSALPPPPHTVPPETQAVLTLAGRTLPRWIIAGREYTNGWKAFYGVGKGVFETGSDAVGVWVGSHRSCVTRVEEGQDPHSATGTEKLTLNGSVFFPVCVRVCCGPSRSNKRAAVCQDGALNDLNSLWVTAKNASVSSNMLRQKKSLQSATCKAFFFFKDLHLEASLFWLKGSNILCTGIRVGGCKSIVHSLDGIAFLCNF